MRQGKKQWKALGGVGLALVLALGVYVPLQAQTTPTVKSTVQACANTRIAISGQPEIIREECLTQTGETCVTTITPYGVVQTCMSASVTHTSSSR